MPFIIPKIVYPADSQTDTLNFTYPPTEKPGADDLDAQRVDSISLSGLKQSLWYRTDTFKHIQMENVPMEDLPAWTAFMSYAMQGGSFLYYEDASQSAFAEWQLEASGGSSPSTSSTGTDASDAWSPSYSSRGLASFELYFRKVPGGLSST